MTTTMPAPRLPEDPRLSLIFSKPKFRLAEIALVVPLGEVVTLEEKAVAVAEEEVVTLDRVVVEVAEIEIASTIATGETSTIVMVTVVVDSTRIWRIFLCPLLKRISRRHRLSRNSDRIIRAKNRYLSVIRTHLITHAAAT